MENTREAASSAKSALSSVCFVRIACVTIPKHQTAAQHSTAQRAASGTPPICISANSADCIISRCGSSIKSPPRHHPKRARPLRRFRGMHRLVIAAADTAAAQAAPPERRSVWASHVCGTKPDVRASPARNGAAASAGASCAAHGHFFSHTWSRAQQANHTPQSANPAIRHSRTVIFSS